MPLGYFRRPLFWVLMAYMLALCLLRREGLLDVRLPPELSSYRFSPQVEMLAVLESFVRGGERVRAFAIASRIGETPCRQRVLVRIGPKADHAGLLPGATLKMSGRLRFGRRPRNPGDFDERGYLQDRAMAVVIHAVRFEVVKRNSSRVGAVLFWAQSLRASLRRLLEKTYPPETSSILSGILLGDKAALEPSFSEALKRAGAFHLIVPSGTNVAFVVAFFLWLAQRLDLPWLLRGVAPLAMAAFYGLMVGCDPPYLRAYLCALLAVSARFLGREHDLFQALVLSSLILLVWDPRFLFQRGFQMSYMVVWALLILEPQNIAPKRWPRPIRLVVELSAASGAAQLALLPLLAGMGGKFSLIGILANVALVPLCGLLLGAGFALWGISWLPLPGLFKAAAASTGLLTGIFRGICLGCGNLPGAAVDLCPMPAPMIISYYLIFAGILFWRHRRPAALLVVAGLGLFAAMGLAGVIRPQGLKVLALSLPGAGASLARFPDGKAWLVYGSGPPGTVLRALGAKGIRRLDKIVFLERTLPRERYRRRILKQAPSREIAYWEARAPFKLCQGRVCFRFDAQGPRLFMGGAEYGALQSRLRWNALEIETDGVSAVFRRAF